MYAQMLIVAVLVCAVQNMYGQIPGRIKTSENSSSQTTVNFDELVVYATILDSMSESNANSHFLIADKTLTFACGEGDGNGLSIAGCNGLRSSTESPIERMAILARDLPNLQKDVLSAFVTANQKYATILHNIPSRSDYFLFNDSAKPKDWTYSFLVYLSRVAFNQEHTEALVNVGVFSYMDSQLSEGHYVVLRKLAGKWKIGETSVVWKLSGN